MARSPRRPGRTRGAGLRGNEISVGCLFPGNSNAPLGGAEADFPSTAPTRPGCGRRRVVGTFPASRAIFLKSMARRGSAAIGWCNAILRTPERSLATNGPDCFYRGCSLIIAVTWMRRDQGLDYADFARYQPKLREPVLRAVPGL